MNKDEKKSGRKRFSRKRIVNIYHESADKVGKHFADNFIARIRNIHEVRLWVIEWVLLVSAVFLFALVQIMWYDDSYRVESFANGGDYTEAVLGEVNSMNPLYAANNAERTLGRLLFANLVSPDASGHNKGELAKTVKMDDSGKIWTVTLRDGILWSDGEAITADDVIYTIDLIRDASAKTTVSADFSRVTVKKIDDKTIEFTLPSTYVDFADTLEFPIVPKHILGDISPALIYESDFSTNPVGSGPFVLKTMQLNSSTSLNTRTIYLSRNDNYFLSDTKLDLFTLKTYKKRDDIVEALNAKEVTATAEDISGDAWLSSDISERESLLNGGVFAFFNTENGVVKDANFRQAIRRSVNMQTVRDGLSEMRALDYPILVRQENLEYPDVPGYDIGVAKELLEKAGCSYNESGKVQDKNGEEIKLRAVVQKRGLLTQVAERFVEEIRQLGVGIELTIFDEEQTSADFFSTVVRPRDYDILFYEVDLGVSADPFVYYSSTQASAGGWNFSNYSNGLVDDALLSAHTTTNMAIRKAKYEYFLKAWMSDTPAIGIYQSSLNYYYNYDVKIFSENAVLTDVYDRFGDVRFWAADKATVNVTP